MGGLLGEVLPGTPRKEEEGLQAPTRQATHGCLLLKALLGIPKNSYEFLGIPKNSHEILGIPMDS